MYIHSGALIRGGLLVIEYSANCCESIVNLCLFASRACVSLEAVGDVHIIQMCPQPLRECYIMYT